MTNAKKSNKLDHVKQGQYVYVDLGNNHQYCEQAGKRPAIVLSNNTYNKYNNTVVIAPITTKIKRDYKTSVRVPKNAYFTGTILLQHVRTVDKQRISIARKYGKASIGFVHVLKKHMLTDII